MGYQGTKSLSYPELNDVFDHLMVKMDQGIRVIDVDENLIIYNDKMREIESMTYEDFDNKGMMDVFLFEHEQDSRLLQAIKLGVETREKKQHYTNSRGKNITTINEIFPIYSGGRIVAAAEIAKDVTRMEKLVRENQKKADSGLFTFNQIIGRSAEITGVVQNAKRATRTSSSVLIVGETGTGKELFAQSIHSESERAGQPFVSQNCAALPETLIEGILFGTVKGAFTGASERAGLFEKAEGGTLLLDEINTLPVALQAKLLRVLQEKKVTRLGSHKEQSINVRIIATMNKEPAEAIQNNELREDLFYRIGVVTLYVPALRERKTDIEPLVETFLEKYNRVFQMEVGRVSPSVKARLESYHWPGNIRELEHVIEGAMNLMLDEEVIEESHLPDHFRKRTDLLEAGEMEKSGPAGANSGKGTLKERLLEMEFALIKEALQHSGGNVMQAAKELGISRQSLQYRMSKFHL
ncbi:sigma-54 interaction domain-containing protein [Marinococcus halophilus]|uniref:sigma-54 interaction domain-containing protein n=1 Tax=Marinococcus halophilus TaxID=1371 RepID=UPI0009A5B13E|nr:sigma 54-interacting transcriptional regulator [Marinococcus halophilus]